MKTLTKFLATLLSIFFFAGCQDYLPLTGGEVSDGQTPPAASDFFSFSTTRQVSFSVDYGKKGSRALVEVYTQNPAYTDEDGNTYFKGSPVFKAFCDEDGQYEGKVNLPTYIDKVWVYTMRMGVPQLVSADVKSKGVALSLANEVSVADDETPSLGPEPPGYTPNSENKFTVIAPKDYDENSQEFKNSLKIWKAPAIVEKTNDNDGIENIYSIVNWQGQRFGRIIPTHYYDIDNNCYYITEENGVYYDNQGLVGETNSDKNDTFTQEDIDIIQHVLWRGNTAKPNGLDNTRYYDGLKPEDINIVIPHSYINNKGISEPVDKAEVWLRFLGEGAWFCNGIGYYYYPSNKPPKNPGDIKNYYVAIPNASITLPMSTTGIAVPFLTWEYKKSGYSNTLEIPYDKTAKFADGADASTFNPKCVPFETNQRIQLLYHNEETGEVSKNFPPGYTIGFFVFSSSNVNGDHYVSNETMHINNKRTDNSNPFFHSNRGVNHDNGDKRRYISVNYKDHAIYGVEDGKDNSYEDILFAIDTNPAGIVVNRKRQTIEDEFHVSIDEYRTYAYEDIWEEGGDYDLNDVVIEHYHKMTFVREGDNYTDENGVVHKGNTVTKIEDEFTAVQPSNAATYRDAFAIQIPNGHLGIPSKLKLYGQKDGEADRTELEITEYCEYDGKGTGKENIENIILFKHIMQEQYDKMILVREFSESDGLTVKNTKLEEPEKDANEDAIDEKDLRNVFNPFIISKYDGNLEQKNRIEIHLPKHKPTRFANTADLEDVDNAFYINKDGKYPFALSIPVGVVSGYEYERFIVDMENEGVRIDKVYPDFDKWVQAGIENNKEKLQKYGGWYLYYRSSIDDNDQENPSTNP